MSSNPKVTVSMPIEEYNELIKIKEFLKNKKAIFSFYTLGNKDCYTRYGDFEDDMILEMKRQLEVNEEEIISLKVKIMELQSQLTKKKWFFS